MEEAGVPGEEVGDVSQPFTQVTGRQDSADRADDLNGALRLARAAICLTPDSVDGIADLGKIHLLWQDYYGGAEWFDRAIAITPADLDLIKLLIYSRAQLGGAGGIRDWVDRLPSLIDAAAAQSLDVTEMVALRSTIVGFEAWSRMLSSPPELRFLDDDDETVDMRVLRKALLQCANRRYERALRFVSVLEFKAAIRALDGVHAEDVEKLRARICGELGIDLQQIGTGKERGYLVIRSHSSGFCADFVHTVVQLIVAEVARRRPVVYWGRESAYWSPDAENLWTEFFHPIGESLHELASRCGTFYPPSFSAGTLTSSNNSPWFNNTNGAFYAEALGREEEVVVVEQYCHLPELLALLPTSHPFRRMHPIDLLRDFSTRFVKVRRDLVDKCETWLRHRLGRRRSIAVHYRLQSSDKARESIENSAVSIETYLQRVDDQLARLPDACIFLLTDFAPAVDVFRNRYPDRILCYENRRLNAETYSKRQLGLDRTSGNYVLAQELMRDVVTASICDSMILDGASSVSIAIACISRTPPRPESWVRTPTIARLRPRWDVLDRPKLAGEGHMFAADLLN